MRGSVIALACAALALGTGSVASAQEDPGVATALEVNHFMVAISVQDIDAVTAFYVDKLGFAVTRDVAFGDALQFRWLSNGNQRIELVRAAGSEPGPARAAPPGHLGVHGFAHLTLETPDILATKAALEARGVALAVDITDIPPLGLKAMFVLDPEGNAIEFAQVVDE